MSSKSRSHFVVQNNHVSGSFFVQISWFMLKVLDRVWSLFNNWENAAIKCRACTTSCTSDWSPFNTTIYYCISSGLKPCASVSYGVALIQFFPTSCGPCSARPHGSSNLAPQTQRVACLRRRPVMYGVQKYHLKKQITFYLNSISRKRNKEKNKDREKNFLK